MELCVLNVYPFFILFIQSLLLSLSSSLTTQISYYVFHLSFMLLIMVLFTISLIFYPFPELGIKFDPPVIDRHRFIWSA
ncbi:hypothetical protein HanRHA438_Chr17g0836571 [Helianthus annuus]|nr:hypothetical protein HanRHA438_Chr17g0836571 [Helianthus annuus]